MGDETNTFCEDKMKDEQTLYCFACTSDLCNNAPKWTPQERFDGLYDEDINSITNWNECKCSEGTVVAATIPVVLSCFLQVIMNILK